MTKQPRWKRVANLGDVNPLDYGGLFVYVDQTGVYAPEMERIENVNDEDPKQGWIVHRVVLEPCTYDYETGILSDNPFHPQHAVWFADDLGRIADFTGVTVKELIEEFLSTDPIKRANAWRSALDYHGWDNGDSYPRTYLKKSDLPRRLRRED